MKRSVLTLLVSSVLLGILVTTVGQAGALPAGERIGEAMEPGDVVQFATVDASPSDYFNRTVLVEAEIVAVCKKKGCWMQVTDEGKTSMVRWETGCGGKYKFPEQAIGKRVLIQGSFYPKELTEEDRAHMEEEAGGSLEIRKDPYEFNASAVLILAEG